MISTLALGVTHRIIAITATVALLAVSFVSSYSVYLRQQREIAQTRIDIAAHQEEITRLQDELDRWHDEDHVRAQARSRLGWVMPGEVGYRVIDENGNVIGGTVATEAEAEVEPDKIWYETLWVSLLSADQPVVETKLTPNTPATYGPDDEESPR